MPARKSAKRAASGTTTDSDDDEMIQSAVGGVAATSPFITRLSRQQLERLLQESVNSGVAPTLAGIKGLLPLSLRTQEVKKVSVAGGDERQVEPSARSNQA